MPFNKCDLSVATNEWRSGVSENGGRADAPPRRILTVREVLNVGHWRRSGRHDHLGRFDLIENDVLQILRDCVEMGRKQNENERIYFIRSTYASIETKKISIYKRYNAAYKSDFVWRGFATIVR